MTYAPRTTAMDHQAECLRRMLPRPAYALLMETGTGKSKPICDEFGVLEEAGEASDVLLFAFAGCFRNWTVDKGDEPDNWCELRKHLSADLYSRLRVATWRSNQRGRRDVQDILKVGNRPRWLSINIEALSSTKDAEAAAVEFCRTSRRGVTCVVDESTAIMHGDSRRTEAVMRIAALAKRRRILTGLVTPTNPLNLYSQFAFLDWRILGFRTDYGFRSRYAITKKVDFGQVGRDGKPRLTSIVVGYRNQEELHKKIQPYSYRVQKKDCLDLPERTYRVREVEMTAEQARIYKEMKKVFTTRIDSGEHTTAKNVLDQMGKLHRILCGHVKNEEDGSIRPVATRRIAELLAELDECAGKAIVWCSYDYDVRQIIDAIRKRYGEGLCAAFWGNNAATRAADERQFLESPGCRFIVATQSAGGRGNTWTVAGLSVYFSNTDNLEHRLQSEDRNHRYGQRERVTCVDLMVPGTVDEKFVWSMRKKIDMASVIQGDNYKDWLV